MLKNIQVCYFTKVVLPNVLLFQEAVWKVDPKPGNDWPQKGHVDFVHYKVRYRPGLDLVLKGISFHVNGGEKVILVFQTNNTFQALSFYK